MNKEKLKDGMVVIAKNGVRRLVFNNAKKYINMETKEIYNIETFLQGDDSGSLSLDQIKVVYMGKTIWEREKEYLTLEEAITTGKRFKHKDVKTFCFFLYEALDYVDSIKVAAFEEKNKFLLEQINSKVWEVED